MTIDTVVNTHLAVWESWNALGYEARCAVLRRWAESLPAAWRAMVEYQCQQTAHQVAAVHVMPGPTGETNELYCAGRGLFVITAAAETPAEAILGQLTAALVTGNTVVLCLPVESALQAQTVESALTHSGCNAISAVPESMIDTLLAHPAIAGVAYAGNMAALQRIARQAAAREGALAAVIGETDVHALPVVGSPTYLLRFVIERTRTINITAVGGNATLLELGSGEPIEN